MSSNLTVGSIPSPLPRALLLALLVGLLGGFAVHVLARDPVAAPSLGTDEAFSTGPYRRAVGGGGAVRFTGARDAFRFERLPTGPRTLEIAIQPHPTALTVVASGRPVAVVPAGAASARVDLPAGERTVAVELLDAGRNGARLQRLSLAPTRSLWPDLGLLLLVAIPVVAAAAAVVLADGSILAARVASVLAVAAFVLALVPAGLAHAPYATTLSIVTALGLVGSGLLARRLGGGLPALAAFALAVIVQGLLATSPVMPVSDAVFHAHKLQEVAGGDWFPVSVTQHAVPFRFPYGVALYALLVPLAKAGLDPVALVRWGAALASLAASVAVYVVARRRGPLVGALAVAALQLLPIAFDVFSYGNLSNVFGQAVTALFFAWWAGSARGGWIVGALLLAIASLAHFSSFVVIGVLVVFLLGVRWRAGELDRTRLVATLVGLALAGAYYASFVPLVLEQLPRLREGGGQGKVHRGFLGEAWDEVLWLRIRWGIPAIVLGVLGRPRWRDALDRDLVAFWAAGAVLAVLALATPVEVRYVYALTLPLALAMAEALSGRAPRLLAWALGLAQVAVGGGAILEALLERYR